MFSVPVSFIGEPRRYKYRVTTHRSPGWSYHGTGFPHHDPFLDPFGNSMRMINNSSAAPITPYKRPDWSESVICVGFKPEEVTLKVSAEKVFVHCTHKDGDDANYDISEKKRTVLVPDDVESGDIKAEMSKGGTLTLTAPYVQPEEPEPKVEENKDSKEKSEPQKESKPKGTTQIKINRS